MSTENSSKRGYRIERIERTVAETLEFELLPSLEDPVLKGLHILNVDVTQNFSCIHAVVVRDASAGDGAGLDEEIQAALDRAQGYLRSELAGVLRIKRMPLLRLKYLPIHIPPPIGGER